MPVPVDDPSLVGLSFESRAAPEMDSRSVAIEVSLRFKHSIFWRNQRGEICDQLIFERIMGESNVSFPYTPESIGLLIASARFKYEFHFWMPAFTLSVCDRLSQDIVRYAQPLALARGGAIVVTASMEVEEVEHHVYAGLQAEMVDDGIVLDFQPPRGLSCGEIDTLKEESFESGGDEPVVCSVCLEELSRGVYTIALLSQLSQ